MENLNEGGIFKHVFRFDQEGKNEMMNIIQYALIAILPVVVLNKMTQKFIPEADDEKSSVELTFEIIAQIVLMLIVMLFIHRFITYIPTYSGDKYPDHQLTNNILSMLVIILSLQTKLGEKISILVERGMEMWEGKKEKRKNQGNEMVKISQPISQMATTTTTTATTGTTGTTSIQSLPQTNPINYDSMYQQDEMGGPEAFSGW